MRKEFLNISINLSISSLNFCELLLFYFITTTINIFILFGSNIIIIINIIILFFNTLLIKLFTFSVISFFFHKFKLFISEFYYKLFNL